MAVYIKTFDNHSDYEEYIEGDDVKLPNVSVCKDMMTEVHYNEYDFRDQYLTFEALESGTFTLTIGSAITTTLLSSVSYSLDDGETWTTTNNVDGQTVTITTPTVNTGGKVLWKGTGTAMSTTTASASADRPHTSSIFTSTGLFDVYGNLLSMLYGDDFENEDSITGTYNFALIFYSYSMTNKAKINSAENLCLRIKNVTDYCYLRMFQGVETMINSPKTINAVSIGSSSCLSMFQRCTNLITTPELPAQSLSDRSYYAMFQLCSNLITPQSTLPATTLGQHCYDGMYKGCIKMDKCPLLPATTLAEYCYFDMFRYCSGITTSVELPATALTTGCYEYMFDSCTGLISAPILNATTLVQDCYSRMFQGCTNLSYIKAMFTTEPSTGYTQNWVNGVSPTGTFIKNSAAQWDVTGVNGIPTNWTVQTASA